MAAELHVGDVGSSLRATIYDDITVMPLQAATTKQYIIRKPSGTEITVDCEFVSDGSDGQIEFVTTSSTLDEAGFYKLQGYIEIGSSHWHTDSFTFRVYPNLD